MEPLRQSSFQQQCPLVVDLDGSLIQTDILYELFVRAIFRHPWVIFAIPVWIFKGKSFLKYKLGNLVDIDVERLPYNDEVMRYISSQCNRKVVLCTASNQNVAVKIGRHLGVFDECIGSSKDRNLIGAEKARMLKEKYGAKGFVYIGNENRDIHIWRESAAAIIVGSHKKFAERVRAVCDVELEIIHSHSLVRTVIKACRVHQWVKNLLVFVPLVASHQLLNWPLLANAVLGFVAFNFCASATYIINDLADLDSDRKHHKKKHRPFAAGTLSIRFGLLFSAFLLSVSLFLASAASSLFFIALVGYIVTTVAYSFLLKRLQTVDILVLAGLYTLRILAGGAAIGVMPSFWLLAFSMFVFLCLALIKRISELLKAGKTLGGKIKVSGRGYYTSDIAMLNSLASSSGLVSILVFAMYLNSSKVSGMYSFPEAMWLICPIFAYWIMRILVMGSRAEIDEDPILFALKDKRSWIAGLSVAGVILVAL